MLEINKKFNELLPELVPAEYEALENSIRAEGCKTPIAIWKNQIVDGHNRFEICQKHDLPFEVSEMNFDSEDDAFEWMYTNQLGRRNLDANQKLIILGKIYGLRKKKEGAPLGNTNAVKSETKLSEKSDNLNNVDTESTLNPVTAKRTAEILAEEHGVNEKTVRRAEKIALGFEDADAETQAQFLKGKISQKKLVEKKKPENVILKKSKADPVYEKGKNEETQFMRKQAKQMETILREVKVRIEPVMLAVRPNSMNPKQLGEFYVQINEFFKDLDISIHTLKNQYICEFCLGTECKDNTDCRSGYVFKSNWESQLNRIAKDPTLRGRFHNIKAEEIDFEW